MAAAGIRTIKTVFTGDAKGLVEAGKKGELAVSKWRQGIERAGAAILAGTAAIGAGLVKLGTDFDEATDTIRMGTGATGQALEGLMDDFRAVAKRVPDDFAAISQAIADLNTRTGQSGEGLQQLAEQILDLSRLTGEDVGATIAAITRLFGDWAVSTDHQAETLDKLWRASQATGISVSRLAELMVAFGAPLRQLGFTFDESAALLSKWEKEGVNTELVLGGLKKALGEFARAGDDPVTSLQNFMDAIKEAGSTAEANQIAVETLGVRAGPDFAAAVREGRLEFGDLIDTIKDGEETVSGATSDTEDFMEKLRELRNRAFLAVEPAANALFEKLNEGTAILENVGNWAERNQGTVKNLAVALGGLAATVLAVNGALKVYAAFQAIVRAATVAWTAVQWLLNVALSANPIGLVIIGVTSLIAGILLLWHNSEGFRKFFIALWEHIKNAALAVGRWFRDTLWNKWIKGAWDSIVNKGVEVLQWFASLPGKLRDLFFRVAEFITRPFRNAFNSVARLWNNTIGSLSWTVPGWVPGIGGRTISAPRLPVFHRGGRVPGRSDQDVLSVLRGGEVVLTEPQAEAVSNALGGTIVIENHIEIGGEVVRVVRSEVRASHRELRRLVTSGAMAR